MSSFLFVLLNLYGNRLFFGYAGSVEMKQFDFHISGLGAFSCSFICAFFLITATGCKVDSQSSTTWTPPKNIQINTPYFIRTIEKNGMDAIKQDDPVIRYIATARYPEYASLSFTPLNEYIQDYVHEKLEDFSDVMLTGSYQGVFPEDSVSEMSIDFTLFHYTAAFTSILFEGFEKTPAVPKGFKYYKSMNYDALNEQVLLLEDCLLGSEELEKFSEIVGQKISELNLGLTEEQIKNATDPGKPENYELFIIRPGEFLIFFQPFQLGPKIREQKRVTVSFNEVSVQPFILDIIAYHSWLEFNGK